MTLVIKEINLILLIMLFYLFIWKVNYICEFILLQLYTAILIQGTVSYCNSALTPI
jgi:hypothetical protein